MTTTGVVTSVTPTYRGDTLAAATTATDTLLWVEDAGDFAEEDDFTSGDQWLVVGDSGPIQYVASDMDSDVLTLANPIGTAFEEGLPVRLWDPTVPPAGAPVVEYLAYIQLADETGTLSATIPHEMVPLAGVDNLVGAQVAIVETDTERWEVAAVMGREPIIDGTKIDPETVPDPSAPTAAPTVSPVPAPLVGPAAVVVNYDHPEDGSIIDLYVSLDGAAPVDATTLHTEGFRPGGFVYNDADGNPLPADTPVFVALVARNELGAAPPSPWVESSAGSIPEEFLSMVVGSLIAERLQGQTIQGVDLIGVTLDIPEALYAEPGYLDVKATSAELLSAIFRDNVTRYGLNNYLHGRETAAAGVSDPSSGPVVTAYYPTVPTEANTKDHMALVPMADPADGWLVVRRVNRWEQILPDGTVGASGYFKTANDTVDFHRDQQAMTRIGTDWWVFVKDSTSGRSWIDRHPSDVNGLPGLQNGTIDVINTNYVPRRPAIGTNAAGDLLVVYCNTNGAWRYGRLQNPAQYVGGGNVSGQFVSLEGIAGMADFAGIGAYWQPLNTNGWALWVQAMGWDRYTYENDGTAPLSTMPPQVPRPEGKSIVGAWCDPNLTDAPFYVLAADGILYEQNPHHYVRDYNGEAEHDWQFTWYDADPLGSGVAETKPSPIRQSDLVAGAYHRVKVSEPPDDGTADAPNTARVYMDGMLIGDALTPDELVAGKVFTTAEPLGAAPPVTSGFASRPSLLPGAFRSAVNDGTGPIWELIGNGPGRVGPLSWNAAGNIVKDSGPITPYAGYNGYMRFVRIGQVVFYEGYIDRDDSVGTGRNPVLNIPLEYAPTSDVITTPAPGYNTTLQYRYYINSNGTVELQRTGTITTNMTVSGLYFK